MIIYVTNCHELMQSSECSSEDSDSSVEHAASQQAQQQQLQHHHHAPLQEINQEDLTTILPPQEQEDAPFDGFEDSESGRLVSKAIERMSLGADSDTSENGDQNPVPVYSSTLLQQFVEKTAMLSEPRKRRSKCGKKLNNDNEYPCVSNVSPDSGIQSVDNSPLHLAISPVSPPASTQSPIQPSIVTKPAVNVDRVLYPPKRKPGRPAKTVSTQPRGPGRPRLKPEIVEKIQKIEKAEKERSESLKTLKNPDSRLTEKKEAAKESNTAKSTKEETSSIRKRGNAKSIASREMKEDAASPASKRIKGKMTAYQKKRYGNSMKSTSQEKSMVKKTPGISSPMRVKCLSRSTASKLVPQCDGRSCRKVRQDRTCVSNKTAIPLTRQKQTSCEHHVTNDQKVLSTNKRTGSKENRNNTVAVVSRKLAKRVAPSTTRRVLKENKCNKKTTTAGFESNGVGVQTLMLPVGDILKTENMEQASNKCDKPIQPLQHNHCHKHHHHHKHRRRLLAPPKNPIRIDPYVIQELEKLIEEFAKLCSLGKNNTSANHSELPQIFRVKKPTKKRKGGDVSANDDQKLKRRLKKEKILTGTDSKSSANTSTSSNPNEQRLPLKKRHYHVSSPHSSQSSNASCTDANVNESNSTESHIEEAIEATITRYGGGSSTSSIHDEEAMPVTPKKRPRDAEGAASEKQGSDEDKSTSQIEVQPRRKKKIVKDLRVTVTKLSAESHSFLDKNDKEKSAEKSSKIVTEKSGKSEKTVISEKSSKTDKTQSNDKMDIEHVRTEKNIKIDSEMHVSEVLDDVEAAIESKVTQIGDSTVPNLMNNTATIILTKKKIRRRKTINRTGFPTLKKKKKKLVDSPGVAKSTVLANRICKDQGSVEDTEDSKVSLTVNKIQNVTENSNSIGHDKSNVKNLNNSNTVQETSSRSGSDEVIDSCPGQLRVRKDLVESDSSVLSEKLYPSPVKYEKIPDCRIYDENASLEESLERYNQNQRIAELNEENLRKLERANAQAANVKMELSGCFNNNHKRRRGSTSPSNLYGRSAKRLRSAGYDTESEAPPSSDVASEDQEISRKSAGPIHNRKKQSRWKKRYLQASSIFSEYKKDLESKKLTDVDAKRKIIVCANSDEHYAAEQLPNIIPTGKLLRQKKTPFQLQYDLLWLHAQSRLSSRDLVPSWNYK